MAKVANRLLLFALCFLALTCGAFLAKGTPKEEGQISTIAVEQVSSEEAVSTMHRGIITRSSGAGTPAKNGTKANYKSSSIASTIHGITQGSSVSRGPVYQRNH